MGEAKRRGTLEHRIAESKIASVKKDKSHSNIFQSHILNMNEE
jgi:hypothetical protein